MRYKHKVQFICQASSMMRIGELVQIRKKHLILDQDRIIVKIPAGIAKFKKARTTFFSKEASKMLISLLRKKDDDDLVFGTSEDPKLSEINSAQILRRILEKTGLNMKYESNNRYKINTHSFRAYGITKVSRHDPNFAKIIAGQKGYLIREYDRLSDEEKLELYKKCEVDLTIDDSRRIKLEKEKLEQEKDLVEKQRIENKKLLRRIEAVEYGSKARDNTFYKNLLTAKDTGAELITIMIHFMFEMSAPEDEKREIWKRLHETKKDGEKFDLLEYLDKSKPSLKNLYSKSITA